jgi:ubiquinone/menaquinone biosynthesis C-methylase UbiE
MNCDPIARYYRWFEYAAFGRRLQKHRLYYLSAARQARRALVLGDGDGRFLRELLVANPTVEVDAVDASAKMLAAARLGVNALGFECSSRVRFFHSEVLSTPFPSDEYDLVVTHFFLDCFPAGPLEMLAAEIARVVSKDATWIVSEFHQPTSGWRNLYSRAWLRTMYLFFGLTTGLSVRRLPPYTSILRRFGFVTEQQHTSFDGLIRSQLWHFSPIGREPSPARQILHVSH